MRTPTAFLAVCFCSLVALALPIGALAQQGGAPKDVAGAAGGLQNDALQNKNSALTTQQAAQGGSAGNAPQIAGYKSTPTTTLTEGGLLDLNLDWSRAHHASPMGVPKNFDWASKPRIEKGNDPGGFIAITGWGHVFWNKDTIGNPGPLEIRNFQTYVCSGVDRDWELAQSGEIEGAQYRADFQSNTAKPPISFVNDGAKATVLFEAGTAFHFWPAQGRRRLPAGKLCGVVVLLEARAAQSQATSGGYLIGLGADYWVDMSSAWDHFKTNKGVGLGRLKRVGPDWSWYGMSTAADADLRRLFSSGLLNVAR